jgi:hypothetical protein
MKPASIAAVRTRIVDGRRRLALKAACVAVGALVCTGTASAQGHTVSSAVELTRQSARLKPGEWVWAPQIAPRGPVLVYVDLSKQLATVYRNGVRIGVATVSSGKPGYQTPTGVFTILQKDAKHRSSKYNSAPMPFQQRLTWDGVALHAGGLPGYPESHGCVHLPMAFARQLFTATQLGTTVIVAGNSVHPVATGGGEVLAPSALDVKGEGDFWMPEKSAAGPVTIVLSRADQAVVVLRNGVPIGRSAVTLPRENDATHVLTLAAGSQGVQQWIYAGVAGHEGEGGQPVDEVTRNKVQIPEEFYERVMAMLQPGATLLVTSASLDDGSTGAPLTVLSGQ